jgi:hypothetical protein
LRWRSVMAGKAAQSRSPRDAGEGRAQRCVPSAREFWRRRRVREECRRASLAGGGRGKFSGAGADVPATAIGIQPCNRERCPTGERRAVVAVPPSPHAGPNWAARFALSMATHRGQRLARKPHTGSVDDRNSRSPNGSNTSGEPAAHPGRMAGQQRKRPERNLNPNAVRGIRASPPRASNRPRQRRARAAPRHRHGVTPTAWCAVAR